MIFTLCDSLKSLSQFSETHTEPDTHFLLQTPASSVCFFSSLSSSSPIKASLGTWSPKTQSHICNRSVIITWRSLTTNLCVGEKKKCLLLYKYLKLVWLSLKNLKLHLANTFTTCHALCWVLIGYPFPEYSEIVLWDLPLSKSLFTWSNSFKNHQVNFTPDLPL